MTNSEPMFTQGVNIENKECQVNMYGSGWRSRMNKRNWEGTVKNVGGELRKKWSIILLQRGQGMTVNPNQHIPKELWR